MKKLFKTLTKRLFLLVTALLIIGLPLFYLSILNSPTAKAARYDDNWAYRQAANLTVTSSSSDVTNLQTLLTLNTSTLISAGKLQPACQDRRFTNVSGNLVSHKLVYNLLSRKSAASLSIARAT